MTDELTTALSSPGLYPIQLTEVHCARASSQRRPRKEEDPDTPELSIAARSGDLSDDGRSFPARIRVSAKVPVLESEIADLQVVVVGAFASDGPIDAKAHADFSARTPLTLLWPYARAYVAQLGLMLGIELPPLPLISAQVNLVPTPEPPEPSQAPDQA